MSLLKLFKQLYTLANRHAAPLLAAGLVAVAARNWQLWQRDKALAAKLLAEPSPLPVLDRTPEVSVLVAAWNEAERIEAHLRSFLALTYPDLELILCAGGNDDTFERAARYTCDRIHLLKQYPGEGKQHALARCFELAKGEIIYLTDADCLYSDEALLRLLAPLVNAGDAVATGACRPLDDQLKALLPVYLWASDTVSTVRSPEYVEGLLGRNAAVTRAALAQAGGLDFVARTGTDYQLARRLLSAGFAIRLVKDSIVPTEYPASLAVYRRKQARWLKNLLIYGRQYGAKQDLRATQRTVLTGSAMLAMPLASLLFGPGLLVFWCWLVAYACLSKTRYLFFTADLYKQKVSSRLLFSLLPLVLVDFAVWSLPGIDLLYRERRDQW